MSEKTPNPGATRRQTIAWTAAAAGVLGVSGAALMSRYHGGAEDETTVAPPGDAANKTDVTGPFDAAYDEGAPQSDGYGRDPDLITPRRDLWPRTVSAPQLAVIDALADAILPGDETRPAPSSLGIADFFSEWLSAPYPDQRADRALILPLIDALIDEGFVEAPPDAQLAKVEALHAAGDAEPAFDRFRRLTAGAYYTTPEGAAIMGFIGNEPSTSFAGPPEDVITHLEREAAKLKPHKG